MLKGLTIEAVNLMSVYRQPDISEWYDAVSDVLDVCRMFLPKSQITNLVIVDETLVVHHLDGEYWIPMWVFESDDPIGAARRFHNDEMIDDMRSQILRYEELKYDCEQKINELQRSIDKLK